MAKASQNPTNTDLKAVDFFCSGGGMSYGLQQAGIKVLAGIDFDPTCRDTYEANIKGAKFLLEDVTKLDERELAKRVGIKKNDDNLIMIGCSPCQYWTIIRTSKKKSEKSKNLLHEFHRFVEYYNPGYVIVENVPGILHKKEESGLNKFVQSLEKQGYSVHYRVVNLNDYGVPETRKRFSLIADRVNKEEIFPEKDELKPTVRDYIGTGFNPIPSGHKDASELMHTTAQLSERNIQRLRMTPKDGGSRLSWANTELQLETYKKQGTSFGDTYGRMAWDKPAPTITTKFYSISNGRFAHPEQDRGLSLREGACLQTFPRTYRFIGDSMTAIARMIGNAVPPNYAKRVGMSIIVSHGTPGGADRQPA